jgi:hypothetical protein
MNYTRRFFESLEWWKLRPSDASLHYIMPPEEGDGEQLGQVAPPKLAYWCLAEPERQYVLYVRGVNTPIHLLLKDRNFTATEFDPRTGKFKNLPPQFSNRGFVYNPPDEQDWVVVLKKQNLPTRPRHVTVPKG